MKVPTDSMQPWSWQEHLRQGLIAVSFAAVKRKGEDLAALREGTVVTDRALGGMRRNIIGVYGAVADQGTP